MKKMILALLKERKEERNKIANSSLSIPEIEQRITSLNYEIKTLESRLATLA